MNRLPMIAVALFVCVGAPAFGRDNQIPKEVREAFEKAAEFELYSLDPDQDADPKMPGRFHGWKVLGATTLKGDTAKSVRAAVFTGEKEGKDSAKCFEPRHGIRIVHEKKTYDLVICYHCSGAYIYDGDKNVGGFTTSQSPEKILTKVLADAKVALPKPAN